jgi:hypothetical protein
MDVAIPNAFAPLLHAAAMMFFPVIMGLSTSLCLRSRPSPFTAVSVHEYAELTVWLDRLWLMGIVAWVVCGVLGAGGADAIGGLDYAVSAMVLVLIAAHLWFQTVLASELAAAAENVLSSGEVTSVSDEGVCIAEQRESDGVLRFGSADLGVKIYLLAGLGSLGLFALAIISVAGTTGGPSIIQCALLAGLYVSLGVILVDLFEDVWPGFTTDARVKRASRYYVQIFEQWKNQGVLAGFLTVLIGAPLVYTRGEAPLAVMSFPIWIGSCLMFATFFNQVLFPRGLVTSTLPLPVWVNVYSLKHPLWANFFAVIHLVMAIALLVGIAVLGI